MAKVHWFQMEDGWYYDTPHGDTGGPFETRMEARDAGYDAILKAEAPKPAPKAAKKADDE